MRGESQRHRSSGWTESRHSVWPPQVFAMGQVPCSSSQRPPGQTLRRPVHEALPLPSLLPPPLAAELLRCTVGIPAILSCWDTRRNLRKTLPSWQQNSVLGVPEPFALVMVFRFVVVKCSLRVRLRFRMTVCSVKKWRRLDISAFHPVAGGNYISPERTLRSMRCSCFSDVFAVASLRQLLKIRVFVTSPSYCCPSPTTEISFP